MEGKERSMGSSGAGVMTGSRKTVGYQFVCFLFSFFLPQVLSYLKTTDLVIVEREKTNRSVHSTRLAHFRYCHVDTKLP